MNFINELHRPRVASSAALRCPMTIRVHSGDLPADVDFGSAVAIDTETLGLTCAGIVYASSSFRAAMVRRRSFRSLTARRGLPILKGCWPILLSSSCFISAASIWLAFVMLRIMPVPVYCTKIASKIARTYTDRHGLKDLTRELMGVDLSKQQQSSDWGAPALSEAQLAYAASTSCISTGCAAARRDAGAREPRRLGRAAFAYLPDRVRLDLAGLPKWTFSPTVRLDGRVRRKRPTAPAITSPPSLSIMLYYVIGGDPIVAEIITGPHGRLAARIDSSEFPEATRRAKAFEAAARHSALVRFLRVALLGGASPQSRYCWHRFV